MRFRHKLTIPTVVLPLALLFAPRAHAQIMDEVFATIHHPFIVGNATLPQGRYVFQTVPNDQLQVMTVRNTKNSDISAEFLVRRSIDAHAPRHTDLIFNKYGNKWFLLHIYESGEKSGVTVLATSREESRLQKQGQDPTQETEEQSE